MPTSYEVIWPDGDIFANADGEIRLTRASARAAAQAIGGTLRPAQDPGPGQDYGHKRLHFYKLTCGHELASLYEWEPGTVHVCRGTGRTSAAHPATIVRRTRARDIAR